MKEKVVLSVFDGMSCGQIALKELNFDNILYYASEVDKWAIKQTEHNFPGTRQLGDVRDVKGNFWVDLFIGGSPCQGFSFAGKGLNFKDTRSVLFFEYVRILKELREVNPDVVFLLENVMMKKRDMKVINDMLGLFPVKINSALVSAQNRERYYWTNIRTKKVGLFDEVHVDIPQPKDRGILLKDILQPEGEVDKKYYLSDKALNRLVRKGYSAPKVDPDKTGALNTKNNSGQCSFDSGTTLIQGVLNDHGELRKLDKATCVDANYFKGMDNHSQRTMVFKGISVEGKAPAQRSSTGRTLTDKHNYQVIQINPSTESGGNQPYQNNRVYDSKGKIVALTAELGGRFNVLNNSSLRRLTPIECSRLQTVPGWYEWVVSDTQAYKMLGNGWTIEVIKHIFSNLEWNK